MYARSTHRDKRRIQMLSGTKLGRLDMRSSSFQSRLGTIRQWQPGGPDGAAMQPSSRIFGPATFELLAKMRRRALRVSMAAYQAGYRSAQEVAGHSGSMRSRTSPFAWCPARRGRDRRRARLDDDGSSASEQFQGETR